MISTTNRYDDAELAEFKILVEFKLEKAMRQFRTLESQIESLNEQMQEDGDWMDDSTSHTDLEMLQTMAHRQRKHIQDLQNALIRIHNKSYGICVVTGELIDKRRLLAVPTTTKCLAAKNAIAMPQKEERKPGPSRKPAKPVIISKIVRPIKPVIASEELYEEEEDLFQEDDYDENENVQEEVDFDSFPAT